MSLVIPVTARRETVLPRGPGGRRVRCARGRQRSVGRMLRILEGSTFCICDDRPAMSGDAPGSSEHERPAQRHGAMVRLERSALFRETPAATTSMSLSSASLPRSPDIPDPVVAGPCPSPQPDPLRTQRADAARQDSAPTSSWRATPRRAGVSKPEGVGSRAYSNEGGVMDDKLEGKKKQAEGKVQEEWGEAKDKAGDAWEDAKDALDDLHDKDEEREADPGSHVVVRRPPPTLRGRLDGPAAVTQRRAERLLARVADPGERLQLEDLEQPADPPAVRRDDECPLPLRVQRRQHAEQPVDPGAVDEVHARQVDNHRP